MLRRILLTVSRHDRIREALVAVPATEAVVRRFVAGPGAGEALEAGSRLAASKLRLSFNYLGEYVRDPAQATRTREGFVALTRRLADAGLGSPVSELSVKLSALGQLDSRDGASRALEHAQLVCAAADKAGVLVTLDMEDHTATDSTLEIAGELRHDFPRTGVVIQAMLRRSPGDCADLQRAGARVRLCKGAYREPRSVALRRRGEIDLAYVRCLRTLFAGEAYPMVATHDPRLIAITGELARRYDRGHDGYEYQMLYGVRSDEQRRLAAAGHAVRVYVPFGPQWYGYYLRRLAERPANSAFLLRALVRGR